jgi:hypothetical protein
VAFGVSVTDRSGEFLRGIQSLRDANIDFLELARVCVLGTHAKLTATVGD